MSWIGPTAKNVAKYGAKYGPHAKVAWELGGKHVKSAVRDMLEEMAVRRKAFDHAGSTRDGTVLRVVSHGAPVYVVFSGEEPVASYPEEDAPLDQLVAKADLSKRVTPAEFHEKQVRARVRRAGSTLRRSKRRI